jgi:hypothetical protein
LNKKPPQPEYKKLISDGYLIPDKTPGRRESSYWSVSIIKMRTSKTRPNGNVKVAYLYTLNSPFRGLRGFMNIIITGASSGVGFEAVLELILSGKHKVMALARSQDKLERLLEIAKGLKPRL